VKIGILTFHRSLNSGAVLQAFALQEYLRSLGFDAKVLNYGNIGCPRKYSVNMDSLRRFVGSLYYDLKRFFTTFAIENYRRKLYCAFCHRYLDVGSCVSKKDIVESNYTHLIVGSDQVWHPILNEGDDMYFLAQVPHGAKRIAYAPSFGTDSFDRELEVRMSTWLKAFDALSVREPQGTMIVKRLCGRSATVVCDPTLLLPANHYESMMRRPRFGLPEKYVAVYTVCGHPWAEKLAVKIAEKKQIPVVHLIGGQLACWYQPWGKIRRITALGPSEWLFFVRHSECVVTNSFHGTVFSLIFHRSFWVTLNTKASDARLTALLQGTSCEARILSAFEYPTNESEIDWKTVDREMTQKSESGKAYLRHVLETI